MYTFTFWTGFNQDLVYFVITEYHLTLMFGFGIIFAKLVDLSGIYPNLWLACVLAELTYDICSPKLKNINFFKLGVKFLFWFGILLLLFSDKTWKFLVYPMILLTLKMQVENIFQN